MSYGYNSLVPYFHAIIKGALDAQTKLRRLLQEEENKTLGTNVKSYHKHK